MQVSFGKIAQDHCNKLIGLFKAETDQARDALSLSCVIAQDQFLLMRANRVTVDDQLKGQQDELLAMLDNKAGVRFNDENLQDTISQLMDLSEEADGAGATPQTGQRASYNVGEVLSAMAATRKRRNLFEGDEPPVASSSHANKVRIVAASSSTLDQTQVIRSNGIEGVEPLGTEDVFNGTFQLPPKNTSGGCLNETVNIVTKSVLKEQSLNKIMSQPSLVTKMARVTKGGAGRGGDNMVRLMKKTSASTAVQEHAIGGRSSPNRVAKARLAASRAGVAALKSKPGTTTGVGSSAQKKWK